MKQKHIISLHRKKFEIPHTVLIFNLEGRSKEQVIKNRCIFLGFYIVLKTLKKDTDFDFHTTVLMSMEMLQTDRIFKHEQSIDIHKLNNF